MKIVDLNLLIYAVNQDAPDHSKAKAWWENALSGIEAIGLPWVVILGFLRITTNPKIMPGPLTHAQAIELVDDWLLQEPVQIAYPTDRHWDILKSLVLFFGTAANLTTDAHIAALAIERGAVLYSSDADFSRFHQLTWVNPLPR
jgi:hypothetical protein